jgi:hypothetical protein
MLKQTIRMVLILAVLASIASALALAQQRGPSTPEERKHIVELVNALEANPLSKDAKNNSREVLVFLADVPDIKVKLCTNVLGDSKHLKGDYEAALVGQLAFSQGKYIIENPDKADDDYPVYLGGVEGVLRTWKSIKAAKPKAKFPLMDELLKKQESGTLGDYVKAQMAGCK